MDNSFNFPDSHTLVKCYICIFYSFNNITVSITFTKQPLQRIKQVFTSIFFTIEWLSVKRKGCIEKEQFYKCLWIRKQKDWCIMLQSFSIDQTYFQADPGSAVSLTNTRNLPNILHILYDKWPILQAGRPSMIIFLSSLKLHSIQQ